MRAFLDHPAIGVGVAGAETVIDVAASASLTAAVEVLAAGKRAVPDDVVGFGFVVGAEQHDLNRGGKAGVVETSLIEYLAARIAGLFPKCADLNPAARDVEGHDLERGCLVAVAFDRAKAKPGKVDVRGGDRTEKLAVGALEGTDVHGSYSVGAYPPFARCGAFPLPASFFYPLPSKY